MYMSRQLISEIKAMLELHLSAEQIAHRTCLSIASVQEAILAINTLKSG
jgi:predicted transposase YdaD